MDSLAFVASIASLLQLVESTVGVFQNYKDLPGELRQLVVETAALKEVIVAISKLPIQAESIHLDTSLRNVILLCQSTCESILHEHARLFDKRSRRLNLLKYFLAKPRLEHFRTELDRHKATFSTIFSVLLHASVTATGDNLEGVQNKLSRLQDLTLQQLVTYGDAVQKESARQLRDQTLDWVSTYDFQAAHSQKASQRLPGTCEWFIQEHEYVNWKNASNGSLMVFGIPGVGKSVICSMVVDDLQSGDATGLTYFYVTKGEPLSLEKILGSIARQLLERSPELLGQIVSIFESRKGFPADGNALRAIFSTSLRVSPQVTVVLDGFDQLDSETGITLLNFLNGLNAANLRWMIFSRNTPIAFKFAQNRLQLSDMKTEINRDIEYYVHSRLSLNRHLLNRPEALERLENVIAAKSSTWFLWTELILAQVQRQTSVKDMRLVVDRLPMSLKDYYDFEWKRLGESDQIAVAFVAFSNRPLTVKALESLLNHLSTREEISEYGSWTFVPNAFIPTVHGDDNVKLVHSTMVEYVKSSQLINTDQISALTQLLELTEKRDPQASAIQVVESQENLEPIELYEPDSAETLSENSSRYSYSESIFSKGLSSTSASSISLQFETVTEQYAKLFFSNSRMKSLIQRLLDRKGPSGFEYLYRELLHEYSEALKCVAKSATQTVAAIMAGDRAVQIARRLLLMSDYFDTSKIPLRDVAEEGGEGRLLLLERYLSQGITQQPISEVERREMKSEPQIHTARPVTGLSHLPATTEDERSILGLEAESDDEDTGEVYVNLEAIKVWLIASDPFEQLLNGMENAVRTPTTVLPDPPTIKSSSEASSKEITTPSMQKLWRSACQLLLRVLPCSEEPLRPVIKRVRWTCHCGISFHDDLFEIQQGAVAKLQKLLNDQYRTEPEAVNETYPIILYKPLFWTTGLVTLLSSALSMKTYLEWVFLVMCFCGLSLSIFVLLIGILLSTSAHEKAVQDACNPQGRYDIRANENESQKESISLDDRLNESDEPLDNDNKFRTAKDSDTSAQATGRIDHDSSSQVPSQPGTSKPAGNQPAGDTTSSPSTDLESSARRKGLELSRNGLWVLGLFDNHIGHLVYAHLDAQMRRTDFTLFSGLREKYYIASSSRHRFYRLRQVSAVRVVKFNITDIPPNASADVRDYDVWPPLEASEGNGPPIWIYTKDSSPPVGARPLIETWRNPHHADKKVHARFWATAKWDACLVEWLRRTPTLFLQGLRRKIEIAGALDDPYEPTLAFDGVVGPNLTSIAIHHPDEERPGRQPRSNYIISRIPKKVGKHLTVNYPPAESLDDDPIVYPEGWGLFLEEKFHVHRFLFFVLLLYSIFCLIVLVLYGLKQFDPNQPQLTEGEIVTICGFVLTYIGLVFTVWMKWAENL